MRWKLKRCFSIGHPTERGRIVEVAAISTPEMQATPTVHAWILWYVLPPLCSTAVQYSGAVARYRCTSSCARRHTASNQSKGLNRWAAYCKHGTIAARSTWWVCLRSPTHDHGIEMKDEQIWRLRAIARDMYKHQAPPKADKTTYRLSHRCLLLPACLVYLGWLDKRWPS